MDRAKCQILNPGKMSFPYSAAEYTWLPRDLTTRQCGEMGSGHTPAWEEKGTSHGCGQQTSNRAVCLTLQGTPGAYEKEAATQTEGSTLSGVEGGGGRIKSTWWHSWPTSGHKLQKQGSRPPHCPVPASKASDLKAEAEVPPSGWLLRVNDEVFKWMLHWNTASISTVLAKNHQIKFIFS